MAVKRHIHKYVLRDIGSSQKPRKVYACAHSDCTHFMPSKELVIGKKSICWQCGEEFIMNAWIVSREKVKPRCNDCRRASKKDKNPEVQKANEQIDDILSSFLSKATGKISGG